MAQPIRKATRPGATKMARTVKGKLWKGSQNFGRAVSWFQSMKSGMPGVDWMAVVTGSEASSLRNIAMQ